MSVNKKIFLNIFLISIVFIAIVIAVIYFIKIPKASWYTCEQPEDCVRVNADHCGCNAMGTATSVNKAYTEKWERWVLSQKGYGIFQTGCLAALSNDWTCVNSKPDCVNNRCELVKVNKLEWASCEQASDCIKAKADDCGCSYGGRAIAVNKNHKEDWENSLMQVDLCVAALSNDWTCVNSEVDCVENYCKLVRIE